MFTYEYKAKLVRIIDGDTMEFVLDLGFNLRKQTMIRLLDVDTHEIGGSHSQEAIEEQKFAEKWFDKYYLEDEEYPYLVSTLKDPGSFGRYLGRVYDRREESELNKRILAEFDDVRWEG